MISPHIRNEIEKAKPVLAIKTLHDIQVETARTWAGRACAAALYAKKAVKQEEHRRWMEDAREYAHEALEHAALSGNIGLVVEVKEAIITCGVMP